MVLALIAKMAIPLSSATIRFLECVRVFSSFEEATDFTHYTDVPPDWFVFVSDIRGSTKAIAAGRYKDINTLGASTVMAVLNAVKPHGVFYVFGGDGATFVAPPELAAAVLQALLGAKELARQGFGFDLRVGRVPVERLYRVGAALKVARFRVSPRIIQSALSGDGVLLAETWVKGGAGGESYEVERSPNADAPDTSGLECRWSPVSSHRGKMVSILVQSLSADPVAARKDYDEVMGVVAQMLSGQSPAIQASNLKLSLKLKDYLREARARAFFAGTWRRVYYALETFFLMGLVRFLWSSFLKESGRKYPKELVENSDYRKFDGMLRMVLDLNLDQLAKLNDLLERKYLKGEVVYGVHASDHAVITCLIFNRSAGEHLHFVDGADGGYCSAAKDLKSRMHSQGQLRKVP